MTEKEILEILDRVFLRLYDKSDEFWSKGEERKSQRLSDMAGGVMRVEAEFKKVFKEKKLNSENRPV